MGLAAAATDCAVAIIFLALWRNDRQPHLLAFGAAFGALAVALLAASAGRWSGRSGLTEPLADAFYVASVLLQAGGCLALIKGALPWRGLLAGAVVWFLLLQVMNRLGLPGFAYAPCITGLIYAWLARAFLMRRAEHGNVLLGVLFACRALVNLLWPVFYFAQFVAVVLNAEQVFVITIALVLIVSDLTMARRRAEAASAGLSEQALALKALNAELAEERSQAMAANHAKSQFLANISHELRTPLNAVIGFADILANNRIPKAATAGAEYGALINTAAQHLLGIINDVLDMSRIESGKITMTARPINLRTVLDAVMSLIIHHARERRIGFSTQIEDSAASFEGDEQLIKQVLTNLLSNAFKYTDPGGAVRLEAEESGPHRIRIEVTDTGLGIAAEDLPHMFEPFVFSGSALTRRRGGIGLGLSITRRLVELHGGTIAIASTLGKGTTVTIELPKRPAAAGGGKGAAGGGPIAAAAAAPSSTCCRAAY
jgi:signal transduction histidine kinase